MEGDLCSVADEGSGAVLQRRDNVVLCAQASAADINDVHFMWRAGLERGTVLTEAQSDKWLIMREPQVRLHLTGSRVPDAHSEIVLDRGDLRVIRGQCDRDQSGLHSDPCDRFSDPSVLRL